MTQREKWILAELTVTYNHLLKHPTGRNKQVLKEVDDMRTAMLTPEERDRAKHIPVRHSIITVMSKA